VLHSLPANYVLYDHVKETYNKNLETGEPFDEPIDIRHDYYLYGHIGGPTKRYRSPAEFLPHLYYLMNSTKETANQFGCHCQFCCPPDDIIDKVFEFEHPEAAAAAKAAKAKKAQAAKDAKAAKAAEAAEAAKVARG
jgi:hypothetical protein